MNKDTYRILDCRGRVHIPKGMRDAAELEEGDIVKLTLSKGKLAVQKVALVESGDQSPAAVEAFVMASLRSMDRAALLEVLNRTARQLGAEDGGADGKDAAVPGR